MSSRKNLHHRLFIAGLCCSCSALVTIIVWRAHFVLFFLPKYYAEQDLNLWWPPVNLEQLPAYLRTTSGLILTLACLLPLLAGLTMMAISSELQDRGAEELERQLLEDWQEEQAAKRKKRRRRRRR